MCVGVCGCECMYVCMLVFVCSGCLSVCMFVSMCVMSVCMCVMYVCMCVVSDVMSWRGPAQCHAYVVPPSRVEPAAGMAMGPVSHGSGVSPTGSSGPGGVVQNGISLFK